MGLGRSCQLWGSVPTVLVRERIDVNHRANGERQLRRQMLALQRLSMALWAEMDVAAVLRTIVEEACEVTGATHAALGIYRGRDQPFDPWVQYGVSPEEEVRIGRRPRPVGLLGAVVEGGEAIRLKDVTRDARFRGLPPGHPPMSSFMGIPIISYGHSVGNLYLANKKGGAEFTDADQRFVELLAQYGAVAVEVAHLRVSIEREQEERVEAERERAQLLDAVERERATLLAVIDASPVGLQLAETGGEHVTSNPRAQELYGALEDPFDPRRLCERLLDESEHRLSPDELPLVRALQGEIVQGRVLLARRPDGSTTPVLVSASPVRGPSGQMIGAVCTTEDVSVLKRLERMRIEWSAVVAHELRQPLSVARAALDHLLRVDDGRQRGKLALAKQATGSIARLIEDLIDVSRLEARRLELNLHPVPVAELVNASVERAREISPDRDFDVELNDACIRADVMRLGQVLDNLLANAVKYGDCSRPIRVEVRADEDEVEVRVCNEGPSLEQAEIDRLFSRFERGSLREAHRMGLGLGLYVARGIVEAHCGRLSAESAGGTTIFAFTLPREKRAAASAPAPSRGPDQDAASPTLQ